MRKCDSCGKVVVNEKDYMCPHCGAVVRKKCDHSTHLPDDKYNRANDYRTTAAEHKSKTYDYEKTPRTDSNQKFDINDLANIKNAEDAKRIAKKAFIEQDQNGRKKFKPLAIVLIVIFAVNIFGNVLDIADSAIDTAFDEIEEVVSMDSVDDLIEDNYGVSEIENAVYTDYDTVYDYVASANVESAYLDTMYDVLEIQLSGIGFEQVSINTEEQGYSYQELMVDSFAVIFDVSFITSEAIEEYEVSEDSTDTILSYADHAKFKGYLSEDGIFSVEGIPSKLDEYSENVFIEIRKVTVLTEKDADCYNGDYNINLNIIRCDSFNNCNFYGYHHIADETLSKEHYEMIDLSEASTYDLQDVSAYSEVIEF